MAQQIPHRIQPDTPDVEKWALVNDNFDKTVQDIADLGAKFSSVANFTATVPAGGTNFGSVSVTDDLNQYVVGATQIVPRVQIHVDTDDDAHAHPNGSSITAAQKNADIIVRVDRRPPVGSIAVYYITIRNFDSSSHTYYVSTDLSYNSSPVTGIFR